LNTQPRLSDLDLLRYENLRLRQQLVARDVAAFYESIRAAYANEGEELGLSDDGRLQRTPTAKPAEAIVAEANAQLAEKEPTS
jgi:hypothetical protein